MHEQPETARPGGHELRVGQRRPAARGLFLDRLYQDQPYYRDNFSSFVRMLPFTEQSAMYNCVNFKMTYANVENFTVAGVQLSALVCPSDTNNQPQPMNTANGFASNYDGITATDTEPCVLLLVLGKPGDVLVELLPRRQGRHAGPIATEWLDHHRSSCHAREHHRRNQQYVHLRREGPRLLRGVRRELSELRHRMVQRPVFRHDVHDDLSAEPPHVEHAGLSLTGQYQLLVLLCD